MRLCGLDITDDCVLHLVTRLRRADFAHQADTLEGALVAQQEEVGLTIPDRIAVLTVRGISIVDRGGHGARSPALTRCGRCSRKTPVRRDPPIPHQWKRC